MSDEMVSSQPSLLGGDLFNSLLVKGVLMVLLGIILLVFTFGSLFAIELLIGLILVILGLQLITSGSTFLGEYKRTWWVIVLGVLAILLGFLTFIFPAVMLVYVMYIIAFTIFISGITDLGLAIMNKCGETNRALIAITGVLGIVLGVMFMITPLASAYTLVQVTGIFLLAFGIIAVIEAFMVRKHPKEA